jgi:hypothetical protein
LGEGKVAERKHGEALLQANYVIDSKKEKKKKGGENMIAKRTIGLTCRESQRQRVEGGGAVLYFLILIRESGLENTCTWIL